MVTKISIYFLTTCQARTMYQTIWTPSITYSLPFTSLMQKQCKPIQSQVLTGALPKLGYNQNLPRAIVHGPSEYGGINPHPTYQLQGAHHIVLFIKYINQENNRTQLLNTMIESTQLESGLQTPFLQYPAPFPMYLTQTWITTMWTYMTENNIKIV